MKNLNNVKMTVNGSMVSVGWQDDAGNRHHVWLEVEEPDSPPVGASEKGYVPVRPFTVRSEYSRNTGKFDGKRIIYRNPSLNADGSPKRYREQGYFETRHLDADSKANAAIVAEALRIAEEGGMYEAAVKANAEKKAAAAAKRNAETAQAIRSKLDEIASNDGPAQSIACDLATASDEVLLLIARAF